MVLKTLQFNKYLIEVCRVTTSAEFSDFFNVLKQSFAKEPWEIPELDEIYPESKQFMRSDKDGILMYFCINGTPMGFRYICYSTRLKMGYVPWGGLISEYQGKGLYPFIINNTEFIFTDKGIDLVLNECEIPEKVKGRKVAESRLRMFKEKLGYKFIDTSMVTYLRNNPWGNIHEEWDWYRMGFKILNFKTKVIKILDNKISKHDYKKLFLALRFFELEIENETVLRKKSLAFEHFLESLSKADEYINLV